MSMAERRRMLLATLGGGTPLSDLPEGSILKILEGGVLTDFYVAKHNYESGLNGAGRTLLVRKDCYDQRAWNSDGSNTYASSSIDSWLNGDYKALFSNKIQLLIKATKFYYTPGNGNSEIATLERAVFLLSLNELGLTFTYANKEGSTLPIANDLKIAYYNGSPVYQFTRTPNNSSVYGTTHIMLVKPDGNYVGVYSHSVYWSRPAFTLPADAPCKPNADGSYTLSL